MPIVGAIIMQVENYFGKPTAFIIPRMRLGNDKGSGRPWVYCHIIWFMCIITPSSRISNLNI